MYTTHTHLPDVTRRALLRRGRIRLAVQQTAKTVLKDWVSPGTNEQWGVNDEWLAHALAFSIQTIRTPRTRRGRTVQTISHLLVMPAWATKDGSSFCGAVTVTVWALGPSLSPDPVVETVLPDDRVVYLHSFLDRIVQRLIVDTLGPVLDACMSPHSHAYRPGRSRWTALLDLRTAIRSGYHHVACADIKSFFPSTSVSLVEDILAIECPRVRSSRLRAPRNPW